ncbi:MAG: M14 family zinc carboxypeptidase [Deltaproteobacteria bacterium]|nr:M14 family zinc carboxypeptidase [Deltaproteobacteria bacterium]
MDLPVAPLVTHREVETRLNSVRDASPGLFSLEEVGRSVEGRAIYDLSFGRGAFTVLLWSQMHGDEPTATSALFDLFEYVRRHRADPAVSRMLSALTVHAVPMLNPDGAERFQRRNAQGLDINRDGLLLQTPEGRALKALRDRLSADVGFNLHNQSWRTSVGRPPRPASISLLSVSYDEARSENAGRLLTKRLCAVIRDALEPLAPGQLSLLIRGAPNWAGTGVEPFTGDVGVGATRTVRTESGRREISLTGRIEDLGDLRVYGAIEEIDARGLTLAPNFLPAARPGDTVTLPDWTSARPQVTIEVGQPARFLLLRPAGPPNTYVVERVIGEAEATR